MAAEYYFLVSYYLIYHFVYDVSNLIGFVVVNSAEFDHIGLVDQILAMLIVHLLLENTYQLNTH